MSDQIYDNFYDEVGDVEQIEIANSGFRRITVFNPNTTYHHGTQIVNGGFGIERKHAPEGMGKIENIKNVQNKFNEFCTFTSFSAALIDVSPQYFTVSQKKPKGASVDWKADIPPYRLPAFQKIEGADTKSCVSLLLVLDDDPDRKLYELTMRSYMSDSALSCANKVRQMCNTLAAEKTRLRGKKVSIHEFGIWVRFGIGAMKPVGTAEQSMVVPLVIDMQDTSLSALAACAVNMEDYMRFAELRKQTREVIKSGYYTGTMQSQSTELVTIQ